MRESIRTRPTRLRFIAPWQAGPERLGRGVRQALPRRVPQRTLVRELGRRPPGRGAVATGLQSAPPPKRPGLLGTRGIPPQPAGLSRPTAATDRTLTLSGPKDG